MAKIQGRESLRKKLRALPAEVRRGMADALAQSADEITEMQRRLVPKKTGDLADSIGWVFGEAPETAKLGGRRKGKKPTSAEIQDSRQDLRVTIFAGDDAAFYARWVEFGTKSSSAKPSRRNANYRRTVIMTKALQAHAATPAQPFFYPAYRANRKKVKSRISRSITKAAKKVAGT
ncbi:HK97-gp10 family putative phage morphogenesis protein [Xanthobacter sp. DSM 24535]|uniref:HK97-gp10 family putative phage morphogenesis protein n=1 Tax=Roseixanthobacter psychrophilus TaxID=3119917 RepID=UPI0037286B31